MLSGNPFSAAERRSRNRSASDIDAELTTSAPPVDSAGLFLYVRRGMRPERSATAAFETTVRDVMDGAVELVFCGAVPLPDIARAVDCPGRSGEERAAHQVEKGRTNPVVRGQLREIMVKAGRPQGAMKGASLAADELARFLVEITTALTVRELAQRFGGGRTMWSEYRSGARIIPLGRLNAVVRDRVRDGRGQQAMLQRARRLHEAALNGQADAGPRPSLAEALRQAESNLAESEHLVKSLLTVVTLLVNEPGEPTPATGPTQSEPETRASGDDVRPSDREVVLDELADRAFTQMEEAWVARHAARQVLAGAQTRCRALPPGGGDDAGADRELVLALARMAAVLEYGGWEAQRLWEELHAGLGGPVGRRHARAVEGTPLEGVVLERLDGVHPPSPARSITAVERSFPPYAAPVLRPAVAPPAPAGRRGLSGTPLAAVAAAAVLAIAALATTAMVVIGQQRNVPPAATSGVGQRDFARSRDLGWSSVSATTPSLSPSGSPLPSLPGPAGSPSTSPSATMPNAPAITPPAPPPGHSAQPSASATVTASGSPQPSTSPSTPPSVPSPADGLLQFTSPGSGMCLAVAAGSNTPGAGLVQSGCTASLEQRWHLTPETTGPAGVVYSIRNRQTGMCLSVDAARDTNDALVTQFECGDRDGLFPDQFWTLRYDSSLGAWWLANTNSGKCVSSRPGSGDNEPITQQDCRDDRWRVWRL
ncbi:RICIN domain-containing protein [Streptomyces sp. NPDC002886]|uniref:RICIN domain-containing protein n=1 Tax=Streptomyces sp. NPDC002886 TaxID=3364667 RepID=UPI0036C3B80E